VSRSRHQGEPLELGARADEARDVVVGRCGEDRLGGVVLRDHRLRPEHRDAVADLERLVEVVGDEHDRLAYLALQAQELVLQPCTGDRVGGAERLVHEHHRRVRGHGPRHPDPLLLAAGEFVRVAAGVVAGQPDEVEQLADPGTDAVAAPAEGFAAPGRCCRRRRMCGNRPTCWMT